MTVKKLQPKAFIYKSATWHNHLSSSSTRSPQYWASYGS